MKPGNQQAVRSPWTTGSGRRWRGGGRRRRRSVGSRTCRVAVGPLAVAVLMVVGAGCVRRTMTFRTIPEGATVRLNDQDIGQTPVTVDFTWYGDYDLAFEKEGYETVRTHRRIQAPWYQIPPFDFIAETLLPVTLHDHRELTEELQPQRFPEREELVQRAREFRERALYGQD